MFNRLRRLPPPITALLLQILALFPTFTFAQLFQYLALNLITLALLNGAIAALLSHLWGLARWWLLIQLFFLPAVFAALSLQLPSHWSLLAFLILLVVYWSTFRTQVPLYLSSEKVWHALKDLLPEKSDMPAFKFIDLGSGLGGVLQHLATVRPDGQYFGIESAPFPFVWSWLRLKTTRNCTVHWGSFWESDLSQYDVVFAYLSPVPMEQLWKKAKKEMRPGSVFISSTFNVPDQAPHETMQIEDLHRSTLLIWRM